MRRLRLLAVVVGMLTFLAHAGTSWGAGSSDWAVYLGGQTRDNAAQDGQLFGGKSLHLTETWSFKTGGTIAGSPAIVGGIAYVPSWDGNLYAISISTHQLIWKTFLGTQSTWLGASGVTSPPEFVGSIGKHGAILVGGGGQVKPSSAKLYVYALDAETGHVLWKAAIGNTSSDAIFDSPLYLKGRVYIGTAGTLGPAGTGILYEINSRSGKVVHKQSMAKPLTVEGGGPIWGSVASDAAGTRIFVPTGDGPLPSQQHLDDSIVAVNPGTLKVLDHWQLPLALQQVDTDDDFGSTPTVFTVGSQTLVALPIKTGQYYAFDANHLKNGPVWTQTLGNSGGGKHGFDDVCSSAYASGSQYPGGAALYVAAPGAMVNGTPEPGGLYALNPADGKIDWSVPLTAEPQEGATTVYDDAVIVPIQNDFFSGASGGLIDVRSAVDGHELAAFPTSGVPFAAPVVIDGTIYFGTDDGVFHAVSMSG